MSELWAGTLGEVGFATYTLKSGDEPFKLAKKFTGEGKRWHEFPAANPGMKEFHEKNKEGVITFSGLEPWHAGLKINIPASWQSSTASSKTPWGTILLAAGAAAGLALVAGS